MTFDRSYLEGILSAITHLEIYLDVSKEDFLQDDIRKHAAAYQFCLWGTWAKLLGQSFSGSHPKLDFRIIWVLNHNPD